MIGWTENEAEPSGALLLNAGHKRSSGKLRRAAREVHLRQVDVKRPNRAVEELHQVAATRTERRQHDQVTSSNRTSGPRRWESVLAYTITVARDSGIILWTAKMPFQVELVSIRPVQEKAIFQQLSWRRGQLPEWRRSRSYRVMAIRGRHPNRGCRPIQRQFAHSHAQPQLVRRSGLRTKHQTRPSHGIAQPIGCLANIGTAAPVIAGRATGGAFWLSKIRCSQSCLQSPSGTSRNTRTSPLESTPAATISPLSLMKSALCNVTPEPLVTSAFKSTTGSPSSQRTA